MKKLSENEKRWVHYQSGNLAGLYIYTTENFSKIYEDGNTDKQMMESIASINPTGKNIFDVGAFIGSSSLVFSKLVGDKGKIVAFEPNPYNLARFDKNIKKNPQYGKNVTVFPYALADSDKNINMILSDEIDNGYSSTSRLEGSHSTINDNDLPQGFREVVVAATTLDKFVADNKISPDILKVDIEGAEYEFLLGAIQTIRKVHPVFYIELHSQYCAAKCTELLMLEGYSINVIHEEDDNRIMVMAEYTVRVGSGADENKLRSYNSAFLAIKNISDAMSGLKKDMQIKGLEISNLIEENKRLGAIASRVSGLESDLSILLTELEQIKSSSSWKVTKPFRTLLKALKPNKR